MEEEELGKRKRLKKPVRRLVQEEPEVKSPRPAAPSGKNDQEESLRVKEREEEISRQLNFCVGEEVMLKGVISDNKYFRGEVLTVNGIKEGMYTLGMANPCHGLWGDSIFRSASRMQKYAHRIQFGDFHNEILPELIPIEFYLQSAVYDTRKPSEGRDMLSVETSLGLLSFQSRAMNEQEESVYVLGSCPVCGMTHDSLSPHTYRYVDNVAFFDDHHLRDPLGHEPIIEPVCLAPPCQHTFSRATIQASLVQSSCCPVDLSPQTLNDIRPAPFIIHSLLDKVRVLCPNNCCDKTIPRSMLPQHLLTCPLTPLRCQRGFTMGDVREKCNQRVLLCDAATHSVACEYRTFKCHQKGCGQDVPAKYLQAHKCQHDSTRKRPAPSVHEERLKKKIAEAVESAPPTPIGTYKWKWGSIGEDNSCFDFPCGIAISANDKEIFVTDMNNNRLQVFSRKGDYIRKWGKLGVGNSQLHCPAMLSLSRFNGEVYVSDSLNHRIQVFDRKGNFMRKWGERGTEDGQMKSCSGIVISRREHIFVSDGENNRIQVFDRDGTYLRQFGTPGTSEGQLANPGALAISPKDEIFVVDTDNHRVQVFEESGDLLRVIGSKGSENGMFLNPSGIAINGATERLYVSDGGNNRVQVFSLLGEFVKSIGKTDGGQNLFERPGCLAVSPGNGDLFVGDISNCIYVLSG